jgi:hypothetical protein
MPRHGHQAVWDPGRKIIHGVHATSRARTTFTTIARPDSDSTRAPARLSQSPAEPPRYPQLINNQSRLSLAYDG